VDKRFRGALLMLPYRLQYIMTRQGQLNLMSGEGFISYEHIRFQIVVMLETGNHLKNGAKPKSLKSRKNKIKNQNYANNRSPSQSP
jgi:hypothetical protein